MIAGKDVHPKRKIYFLGAQIIKILKSYSLKNVDSFTVFHELNKQEVVSFNLFIFSLDWLFIIGAISYNNNKIEKCF